MDVIIWMDKVYSNLRASIWIKCFFIFIFFMVEPMERGNPSLETRNNGGLGGMVDGLDELERI